MSLARPIVSLRSSLEAAPHAERRWGSRYVAREAVQAAATATSPPGAPKAQSGAAGPTCAAAGVLHASAHAHASGAAYLTASSLRGESPGAPRAARAPRAFRPGAPRAARAPRAFRPEAP